MNQLPKVTVQQLEYLDAVAAAATWAEAAEQVGVSPSALSQGLAELERRVGLALFEAGGRRKVLSDDGRFVLEAGRRMLAEARDLAEWIDRRQSGQVGVLRVGMIDVCAVHHFPDRLATFRQTRPEVELRLVVAPSAMLLDRVQAGDLDLVVCVAPNDGGEELVIVDLFDEPLSVYAPDGRRIGEPGTWGPWITFPPDSLTRRLIGRALRERGAPFEVVAESHQPDVIREMVNLSIGWTVLPEVQAESGERPLRRAMDGRLLSRRLVTARRRTATNPLIDELAGSLSDGGV